MAYEILDTVQTNFLVTREWFRVRVARTTLRDARLWMRLDRNKGEYGLTYGDPQEDSWEFRISDPDVAFEFKLRFG